MSGKDRKALRSGLPARAAYEVGYCKPPKETRFRPGVSGNPGGRPKGAKNKRPALREERLKGIILEEAYRDVKVRDGDEHVSVPVAQAVVRTLAVNAAKGQARAQSLFTQLLAATEQANKALHDEFLETVIEYKLGWEKELERRKALGINAPDPIPHPDDLEIDFRTGEVFIKGPFTKEEKARWDWLRGRKRAIEEDIANSRQLLRKKPRYRYHRFVEEEIAHNERLLDTIRRVIPD